MFVSLQFVNQRKCIRSITQDAKRTASNSEHYHANYTSSPRPRRASISLGLCTSEFGRVEDRQVFRIIALNGLFKCGKVHGCVINPYRPDGRIC